MGDSGLMRHDAAPLPDIDDMAALQAAQLTRVVSCPAEVEEIFARALVSARECLSMLPGGPYPVSFLRSSWDNDITLLERGVRCCVLYQADAVRDAGVLRYLSEFAARGAQVRVVRRIQYRTLIVDGRLAFLGMAENKLDMPYLMVREPSLVRSLREKFTLQWKGAYSVGVGPEDSLADEIVVQVIRVLMSGVTDEVAARQLDISIRTMRRRVAAVMEMLGASSRFEAGIKAAKYGWV